MKTQILKISYCIILRAIITEAVFRLPGIKQKKFDFEEHCNRLSEQYFTRLYRVTKDEFHTLCRLIETKCNPLIARQNIKYLSISTTTALCVTLRLLEGASYLDLAWTYGISPPSVYRAFHKIIIALDECLPKLKFPVTENECKSAAKLFKSCRKSPLDGVIASLDGIAIAIKQPSSEEVPDPKKYYNRKKYFALCVQAAVTADYKFVFVSASHAGSTHDSTAFQASGLFKLLSSERLPSWAYIVGDDAYVQRRDLITPFSGRGLSLEQDSFNVYQSSCRMVVEQAFGMLVNRFGILWSPMRFSLGTCTRIIGVVCKLHNFIIDSGHQDLFSYSPIH